MSNQTHLFKTKRFLPLFITQFFGAFNDNAFKNAFLIWFTFDAAIANNMDTPMMVSIAAGLFILPFFLFSALAGQIVDKYQRSWLAQKIKQVEILLMILCMIGFYLETVYGLLVILFMMGTQSTFFGPIKYSLLPEHLRDHELIGGNGLIEGGTFLAILLGTIFGGILIRTEHGIEMVGFAMISFAVIGWLSSRHIPHAPIGDGKLRIGWNLFKESWKIIGYAKQEPTVWLAIIGISWFWLVGATFLTQFPIYAKNVIGGNEHIVTLFLTMFSIGVGLGSLWCNTLLKGAINGHLVPYGAAGITIAIATFTFASHAYTGLYPASDAYHINLSIFLNRGATSWVIIFSLFLLSISAGIFIVPLYAIMQHRSNEHFLARIIASNNILNAFFMVIGTIGAVVIYATGFTVVDLLLSIGIINLLVLFFIRKVIP